MFEWMSDEAEARRKPIRTLTTAGAAGFIGVGAIVYLGGTDRSWSAAIVAGTLAGAGLMLMVTRVLWPSRDTANASDIGAATQIANWHFPAICLLAGVGLLVAAIWVGSGLLVLAGMPFVLLALGLIALKRRLDR